jgi:hypothetical protein
VRETVNENSQHELCERNKNGMSAYSLGPNTLKPRTCVSFPLRWLPRIEIWMRKAEMGSLIGEQGQSLAFSQQHEKRCSVFTPRLSHSHHLLR